MEISVKSLGIPKMCSIYTSKLKQHKTGEIRAKQTGKFLFSHINIFNTIPKIS